MPLFLAGLGIYGDENSERIKRLAEECDVIYFETYTSPFNSIPSFLDEFRWKIRRVSRGVLEEESDKILREARDKKVLIITPGNPLIATTHINLIIDARRLGIDTDIIHSTSSVCAAVAEAGLQIYKIGGVATVMRREKSSSLRAYELLRENADRGMHTILLMEYDAVENYIMSPAEALSILLEYDVDGFLKSIENIVVVCNLGSINKKVCVMSVNDVLSGELYFSNNDVCIMIVPGKMHFVEKEYIDTLPRCSDI